MQIKRYARGCSGWPEGVESVFEPPRELFVRGAFPEGPAVGVVGTRRMSDYGRQVTRMLVPELVRCGVTVVSGLALGIDGEAHRTTLDAGGKTVAVIGSGVDDATIYPRAHLQLATRIMAEGGAVMSEYPPGTPSLAHHFPARNRIVVGLSQAVLVIEAPQKSGAMITARLALESGRDVWAVPGPITHPNGWGPNELIKNGATPITGAEDIRFALGFEPSAVSGQLSAFSLQQSGTEQNPILTALASGALTADQISRATGITLTALSVELTELEMQGRIASFGGGRFGLYT